METLVVIVPDCAGTLEDILKPYTNWRKGGHRGPMTAAQKKTKAKNKKKRKSKR